VAVIIGAVAYDSTTVAGWRKLAQDLRAHAETLRPEGRAELIREAADWERKAAEAESAAGIVASEPPGPFRAKRLRDKAEEYRLIASQADAAAVRDAYRRLAEAYDLLARQDELLSNSFGWPDRKTEAC
jgi:hypothetical protein